MAIVIFGLPTVFVLGFFFGAVHQDRRISRDLADISRALARPRSLSDRLGKL